MNNGAFGENFPYSNFHDLNMDWIIKIAKDFLDQYTHIQEVIANGEQSLKDLTASGLTQLQEKADALEALLQQWYDTHSEDIANQLADALEDLNEWYTTHQGYLDKYLQDSITTFNQTANQIADQTIARIPADYTSLSNDVTNLENAIEDQYDNKLFTVSPNMYNKNAPGPRPGYWASPEGWVSAGADKRLGTTHPIYLIKGKTYKWPEYNNLYGVNTAIAYLLRIPGDGEIIDITNKGTVSSGFSTVTINKSGWYVFNINVEEKNTFMFCISDQYPNHYYAFNIARMASDYPNIFLTFDGDGTVDYLSTVYFSPNLFNKNSELIQTNRYCNGWSWTDNPGETRIGTSHPIYLKAGVSYKWKSSYNVYGYANSSYLWRTTSQTDLTLISRGQGTYSADYEYLEWTCNEEGWWVVNINITEKDSFMFCESSKYPSDYSEFNVYYASNIIDYSKINTLTYLPLAGKTLVCDGDSIASATPDDPESKGGWFGRLRDEQKIIGKNFAVGGGSITYLSDTRHCISRSIDTIHSQYPELDYLLLEGGTNDADLIGQWSGNTPPTQFGTWSATDFDGPYDDTTFCGAVESMFYKSLNYWPHAHIGFIVAMEMGTNLASLTNRKRYFDEIVKIAEKWHIPVLNLWNESGADARLVAFYDPNKTIEENVAEHKFYRDGQHPSSYGYNKMQTQITAWVKGL